MESTLWLFQTESKTDLRKILPPIRVIHESNTFVTLTEVGPLLEATGWKSDCPRTRAANETIQMMKICVERAELSKKVRINGS